MIFSEKKSDANQSVFFILLVVAAILFIRKTDSFTNPQFWAEDGTVFFLQQLKIGASSVFEPYAGYLHLAPRLIAIISDLFPYSIAPAIYNYLSLSLTLLVVYNIFSPRLKIDHKLLIALAIVLVPNQKNEVFVNATNAQWTLSLLLIISLLKDHPDRVYGNINLQKIIDCSILILCGLTGPFVIFTAPLFLCKYFRKKDSYNGLRFLLILALSAVQLFFILKTSTPAAGQGVYNINHWSKVIGLKLFGNLFLGDIIPYEINATILSIFCISLPFLLLYFSLGDKKRLLLIGTYLYFGIAIAICSFYKFRGNPLALVPLEDSSRYFYVPYVMLTWSLISCLSFHEKWKSITVLSMLFLILISSLSSGFRSSPYEDYNWRFFSKQVRAGRQALIPINPKGWFITFDSVTENYANILPSVSQGAITGQLVPRYRLYNPYTLQHHFTTDVNEAIVLSYIGWTQEGIAYYIYDAAVTVDSVQATPFYRLYNPNTGKHHWTTDADEYNVLGGIGWTQEGIDSYIFRSQVTDTAVLYRLYNPLNSKYLWTTDLKERNVLVDLGWDDEGVAGYVFDPAS